MFCKHRLFDLMEVKHINSVHRYAVYRENLCIFMQLCIYLHGYMVFPMLFFFYPELLEFSHIDFLLNFPESSFFLDLFLIFFNNFLSFRRGLCACAHSHFFCFSLYFNSLFLFSFYRHMDLLCSLTNNLLSLQCIH